MQRFLKSQRGYVLVLTLLFMPIFIGIGLLVIDISRASNAQQDHQAAADALALAGARELDGRTDSITRAQARMSEMTNTVSFVQLGVDQVLQYDPAQTTPTGNSTVPRSFFKVSFLKDLPTDTKPETEDDDLAITSENLAQTAVEAKFVYVQSITTDVRSLFFLPAVGNNPPSAEDYRVGAYAVARLEILNCDPVPIFMCNPFANASATEMIAAYEAN